MTSPKHRPTRVLRDPADLVQLKRQAKELLKAYVAGRADAVAEVTARYQGAHAGTFALHEAQLVLARSYGFASWPKLKAYVDGVTVRRLAQAVRAGDVASVRSMIAARPELVHLDLAEDDEHQALHHAVLTRQAEIVRLLMRHGADARKGIWPHRDATSALTIADERGYTEIAAIIRDEEARRQSAASAAASPAAASSPKSADSIAAFDQTARTAVVTGDASWLRARHAEGALAHYRGLIGHAVRSDREDMLALLLELGLDPDEADNVAGLDEIVPTWGEPLRECARSGKIAMARILLTFGANPNTNVYAASSAMSLACSRQDAAMIALLESHGGRLTPVAVGGLGLVDHAIKLLAEDAAGRTPDGLTQPGSSVAQDLLWGAIESGTSEIVRLALERLDWARDDPRWHGILENALYLRDADARPSHVEGFRLTLARADPNVRSRRGATLLHDIAASRGGLTAHDRVSFASLALDAGARLDIRDDLLRSTPLGWACRWGRIELVTLFLERGADPVEADADAWATPTAWAEKMQRQDVLAALKR